MKKIFVILVLLLFVLIIEIHAQGSASNWQPPPYPKWFTDLSKTEQNALIEMGVSSWITNIVLSPGLVRIETRKILEKHGVAWAI